MFSFFKNISSNKISKNGRVYLDHAGATEMSKRAQAELARACSAYGNPSAIYKEGVDAKNILKASREKIGKILSCHFYEIYFTGSGTESVGLAIVGTIDYWHSTHKSHILPNDANYVEKFLHKPHVITTTIEHPAVLETLRKHEHAGRIRVSYVPVNDLGVAQLKDIRKELCLETILVSVMYVNNEIGTIQPVKEIGRLISQYRDDMREKRKHAIEKEYPYFHIDACQAPNYLSVDTKSLRADMMTLNSSKIYGPKGVGLLYKREGVMILPIINGGGQERGMRSGTEAVPLITSFAEALLEASEMKESESIRLLDLRRKCVDELKKRILDIRFYGSFVKEERVPNNINCRIPGIISEEVILRLDAKGFSVSHKSACASESESGSHVIIALGEDERSASENLRITLGRSTNWGDLLALVKEMESISKTYRNKNK